MQLGYFNMFFLGSNKSTSCQLFDGRSVHTVRRTANTRTCVVNQKQGIELSLQYKKIVYPKQNKSWLRCVAPSELLGLSADSTTGRQTPQTTPCPRREPGRHEGGTGKSKHNAKANWKANGLDFHLYYNLLIEHFHRFKH